MFRSKIVNSSVLFGAVMGLVILLGMALGILGIGR